MRELKEKYCLGPDEQSPIPSTRIEVVVYQNGHEDLVACKNSDRRDGISYCSGTGVPCRYHEDPPTQ